MFALFVGSALSAPFVTAYSQDPTQPPKPAPKQTKKKAPKVVAPDPVPPGAPLTVEFISRMLERVKAGAMAESRVEAFVGVRGLEFMATKDNLDRLRAAGASDALLEKITALSPAPAPPPPPPPPVTGTLEFTCAPVECNIRLDGGPDKSTKDGKLLLGDLVFRDYTVDFRKDGYMPQSRKISVMAPAQPVIAVRLEIAPETRARWGAEMYKKLVDAIGGGGGLDQLKGMSGTGAVSSWDVSGALSEWSIRTTVTGVNSTYDMGNASSGNFSVACQGESCGPKGGKSPFGGRKKVTGAEAAALNTNLIQFNRYHLLALLQRIGGENHKLFSNTAPSATAAEQHLIVDSRDETYDIALDGTFLPSVVTYRSKDGLASVKITYAQYAAFEKGARYPRHTSIALPGEKQHGIQVRYETLTTPAK